MSSPLRRIGQPLNHVPPPRDAHDGHPGHLADPPLQVPVVGRDDVDPVLLNAVDEAVVGVGAAVGAGEALPALVARDAQRDAVAGSEFFEFGHSRRLGG